MHLLRLPSTVNPTSLGLWGLRDGVWYRVASPTMTPGPRAAENRRRARRRPGAAGRGRPSGRWWPTRRQPTSDPAPAGWRVEKGRQRRVGPVSNHRRTAAAGGRLVICQGLRRRLRKFTLYCWDEKAGGRPGKVHDHAMDDIRYFAASVAAGEQGTMKPVCGAGAVLAQSARRGRGWEEAWVYLQGKENGAGSGGAAPGGQHLRRAGQVCAAEPGRWSSTGAYGEAVPLWTPPCASWCGWQAGSRCPCRESAARRAGLVPPACEHRARTEGIQSFLDGYLDSMLTFGRAVGDRP